MKVKQLLVGLGLLVASQANAVVADRFQCRITFRDKDNSILAEAVQDALGVRKPIWQELNSAIYTSGEVTLSMVGKNFYSNFRLEYVLATDGMNWAKQYVCYHTASNVDNGPLPQFDLCPSTVPSPDSDSNRWRETSLVNGLPVFNSNSLGLSWMGYPNGRKMEHECKFLGTVE